MKRIRRRVLVSAVAFPIVLVCVLGIGCSNVHEMARNQTLPASNEPGLGRRMTPDDALSQFEESYQKYTSVSEVIEASPALIKGEIRVPKTTFGETLKGAYVKKSSAGGFDPNVYLVYSDGLTVNFTTPGMAPDYDKYCQWARDMDAQGYGAHTTYAYATTYRGFPACAQERGQNADGTWYATSYKWYGNGVEHTITDTDASVTTLIQVADSMY